MTFYLMFWLGIFGALGGVGFAIGALVTIDLGKYPAPVHIVAAFMLTLVAAVGAAVADYGDDQLDAARTKRQPTPISVPVQHEAPSP